MKNVQLPALDDIRRRQFFTVPHNDVSASYGASAANTSLQTQTSFDQTLILKKARYDISMSANSSGPLTTATLRADSLRCNLRNSPEGNTCCATLPPNFSTSRYNRGSGATPTFRSCVSENAANSSWGSGATPTFRSYVSENAANSSPTCSSSGTVNRHESVSGHIKTLHLSELGPGGDDSPLRHRTSLSSVHWNVRPHNIAEESSHDSDRVKAGRQLAKSSQAASASSRQQNKSCLKQDRQTKLDQQSASSAGETVKRSANSPSKLYPAALLLCFLMPLGYVMLHTSQSSQHVLNHQFNLSALDASLLKKVYGQHIALGVISQAFRKYMSRERPPRPLVLSFHGWTGVGKNHVVNIIAEELESLAVHKIIMPLHSVGYNVDSNQRLMDWFSSNVSNTSTVLFVIDEFGKAASEFQQGLHDLLSQWQDKIYASSHVILILLSNTGGTAINQYMCKCVDDGCTRESVTYDAVVTHLTMAVHNTWLHNFLSNGLIDHVVPFLPLERSHVVECVEAYMRNRRMAVTASVVDNVLSELRFFPEDWPVFSQTGCRQVAGKVDLIAG